MVWCEASEMTELWQELHFLLHIEHHEETDSLGTVTFPELCSHGPTRNVNPWVSYCGT